MKLIVQSMLFVAFQLANNTPSSNETPFGYGKTFHGTLGTLEKVYFSNPINSEITNQPETEIFIFLMDIHAYKKHIEEFNDDYGIHIFLSIYSMNSLTIKYFKNNIKMENITKDQDTRIVPICRCEHVPKYIHSKYNTDPTFLDTVMVPDSNWPDYMRTANIKGLEVDLRLDMIKLIDNKIVTHCNNSDIVLLKIEYSDIDGSSKGIIVREMVEWTYSDHDQLLALYDTLLNAEAIFRENNS